MIKILLDRPEFPCNCCQYFVNSDYTTIGKECNNENIRYGCEKLDQWDVDKYVEITDEELDSIWMDYEQESRTRLF